MRDLGSIGNLEGDVWGYPNSFVGNTGLFKLLWNMNKNRNTDKRVNSITSIKATFSFTPTISLVMQGGLNYTDTDISSKFLPYRKNEEN
jgi:hypothetical protein